MIFRKKRIKELENTVASLVRTVETLQGRIEELEDDFEKMENSASTEKENKNELDYKGVIDEWLNGSANGTNK